MPYLTQDRLDMILDKGGPAILKRIHISPIFMAELVSEGVINTDQSLEIQAQPTPGKKKNELLDHLAHGSIEAFISFCIVLEEKQKRRDIVHGQFGLDLWRLKQDREEIRRGGGQSASYAGRNQFVQRPSQPSDAPVQKHVPSRVKDPVAVTPNPRNWASDLSQCMQGDLKPRHVQKVGNLIGSRWQELGVKLNIPYSELQTLATPLSGGPAQYAARMFNTWYRENAQLSIAEVQEDVVDALEEAHRSDVAEEVRNKHLQTDNDIQRVFQEISVKLMKNWEDVGLNLNLSFDKIEACKMSPGLEEDPRKKMLQMWQQRTTAAEQRAQLITALDELGLPEIINAIVEVDKKARGSTSSQPAAQPSPVQPQTSPEANKRFKPNDPEPGSSLPSQPSQSQPSNPSSCVPSACHPPGAPPGVPPSANLTPEDIESLQPDTEVITSLQGNMENLNLMECKMLHDPHDDGVELNQLNPTWHAKELDRLRWKINHKNTQKPVIVALLDSGVYTDHPNFRSNLIIGNQNCIGTFTQQGDFTPDSDEEKDLLHDKANHGTMSAGILWQCATEKYVKILNLKVMRGDANSTLRYVAEALRFIKKWDNVNPSMAVDIVLMTLGCPQADPETDKLLSELGETKILVCSASNEGQQKANSVLSPACHGNVIAIGSCDRLGNRCSHSGVGQELDFLFPGEKIQSTSSKRTSLYVEKSGTSFAAPYAASLMALILSYVETHITELPGKGDISPGAYWRKVLTKSSEMRKLLKDFCHREHNYERGFGAPEVDRISKDSIQAYLRLTFNIPE